MAKNSASTFGLRGIPFIAFQSYMTLITRPQLDLMSRANCLQDTLSILNALYGTEDKHKGAILKAQAALLDVRNSHEPFELHEYAFQEKNEYLKKLDALENAINVIIVDSNIFASAGNQEFLAPESAK